MSTIPTSLTEEQFEQYVSPYLSKAKRGFVSSIPLFKIFNYILHWLYTGCQWQELPIAMSAADSTRPEISPDSVYYHHRKWSKDGSLKAVWENSIRTIAPDLDLSRLNLDGTHTIAKKGGESVTYQGRKKAKTSNILPILDAHGYIVTTSEIVAGNHNDAYELKANLKDAFQHLKDLGLSIAGSFFNADAAFDSREARKICFNHGLIPNIPENQRNRKKSKRGRKRLFSAEIYKQRFVAERTFAWVDKFLSVVFS
jgi:transposase